MKLKDKVIERLKSIYENVEKTQSGSKAVFYCINDKIVNIRANTKGQNGKFWFDVTQEFFTRVEFFVFACESEENIYLFPSNDLKNLINGASVGGWKQEPQFTVYLTTHELGPAGKSNNKLSIEKYYNDFDLIKESSFLQISREEINESDARNKYGLGGESKSHLNLKEYIAQNPSLVGFPKNSAIIIERKYPTRDRVDLVIISPSGLKAVVEIELFGEENLIVGAKQLVKYRVLESVENNWPLNNDQCKAILVARDKMTEALERFCKKYSIEFYPILHSTG